MNYIEHIDNALAYIEANLKSSINLDELASASGYSKFHFIKLFKEVTCLTPIDYIRKRRLSEIAREISQGDKNISEIAFDYGFNSKENFTRAFKNEHHVLPTEYKASSNSLKLYDRIRTGAAPLDLTPEIVTLDDFCITAYKSDEAYTPNFWNKYNCKKLSLRLSGGKVVTDYGVNLWNTEANCLDYWCGIRTQEAQGDTSDTVCLKIPGGLYAVFNTPQASHFDFVNTIHRSWNYILNIWLPQSDYKCRSGYQFESYIETSRSFSEKIHIPIEMK